MDAQPEQAISTAPARHTDMKKVHVLEFVARLKHTLTDQRQRVTWLLGAGCSASSRIPTASGMVQIWLRELHAMQGTRAKSFNDWVKTEFDDYTDDQAGRFYARVFQRRHPSPLERQRAIEMFCSRAQPGYGYATFAQLLSHERYGGLCNTVLTTNFDDLVADALYLHGAFDARPQVIAHEAATHFARISSPRPTVIKLHGDAHLDPKNIESQTKQLADAVCLHLHPFLSDSALIFLGYNGGDESIATFFCGQPPPALAPQIYWIGSQPPASDRLAKWFAERSALHVDHRDFDSLMHLIRGALEIPHPKFEERMKEIAQQYHARRVDLEKEAAAVSDPEEKAALENASTTTEESLTGVWAILAKAQRQRNDDPNAAEKLYQEALKVEAANSVALNNYAYFLQTVRKDMDRAEAHYKRAIEADPKLAPPLANYAHFLQSVRKDMDTAETHYKRAIEADPKLATPLTNYAYFLQIVRKDMDTAEAYYKRAIEAEPKNAYVYGTYANFLETVRMDMDGAEAYYQRALEADPKLATPLANYAHFLQTVRKDTDRAEVHYRRAIEADPKEAGPHISYAALLGERGDFVALRAQLDEVDLATTEPRFAARLHFLRFAHLSDARDDALRALSRVLPAAEPSPFFRLMPNVERARADGHPDVALLDDLARVLKGEASIKILDRHSTWLAAKGEQTSHPTSQPSPTRRRPKRSEKGKDAKGSSG
jgi:Tfp pilus assembly protein PilF